MAYGYKEVDIDEMDIEYTFTAEELKGVSFMNMINLNIRGLYISTYHLPLSGVPLGQEITIRNRDFSYQWTGRYSGVRIVLSDDPNVVRNKYYFYFKNQTCKFVFDGKKWLPSFSPTVGVVQMNFMKDATEYGYLNLSDYEDVDRNVLFGNLNMGDFKIDDIKDAFFKHGTKEDFGVKKADSLLKHTHNTTPHTHNTNLLGTKKVDRIGTLGDLFDLPDSIWGWVGLIGKPLANWAARIVYASDIIEDSAGSVAQGLFGFLFNIADGNVEHTDETSLIPYEANTNMPIMPQGSVIESIGQEENRPKNLAGQFVIKAW